MNVTGGSTDVTTYFNLVLIADGTPATGLTITDIDLQYVRSGVAPVAKVDATALAATDSAHADNKAIEIDATDQPGLYRVDWPDAAFAAGVKEVILTVKCALVKTEHLRVSIDAPVNVTTWGGTGIATPPAVNATQISGDSTAADNLEAAADGTGYNLGGGSIVAASVTGAVGSVTGNVGGNVAGSVGSVTAAITLPTIPTNWITADGIANGAIDAATFAADVDAEFLSYIVDDATRIDASALNTAAGTTIPAIVADTNELQTDWTNGGRLDLLVDAILADTDSLDTTKITTARAAVLADLIDGGRLDLIFDAILADTGTDGVVVATGSKTGYALTSGERDSIAAALLDLANGVETGYTPRQVLRLVAAVLCGKSSNGGKTYRDITDAKARVTGTMDGSNNRTAVTLDAT